MERQGQTAIREERRKDMSQPPSYARKQETKTKVIFKRLCFVNVVS